MRSNKREIPIEFKNDKSREVFSSLIGYNEHLTLVSYVPKKNKSVLLLSTEHHSVEFDLSNRNKPNILLDYNKQKGGVDTLDKLLATYTCKRKTNRWPLNCFFYIVDCAAYNAFVLKNIKYTQDKNLIRERRFSLESLAFELIKPFIELRKIKLAQNNFKHVNSRLIDSIRKVSNFFIKPVESEKQVNRKNCQLCYLEGKKTKISNICEICKNWICKDHLKKYCQNCSK